MVAVMTSPRKPNRPTAGKADIARPMPQCRMRGLGRSEISDICPYRLFDPATQFHNRGVDPCEQRTVRLASRTHRLSRRLVGCLMHRPQGLHQLWQFLLPINLDPLNQALVTLKPVPARIIEQPPGRCQIGPQLTSSGQSQTSLKQTYSRRRATGSQQMPCAARQQFCVLQIVGLGEDPRKVGISGGLLAKLTGANGSDWLQFGNVSSRLLGISQGGMGLTVIFDAHHAVEQAQPQGR